MKLLIAGPLMALLAVQVQAASIAMEDQSQIPAPSASAHTQYFQPPAESELPDNAYGKLVREGAGATEGPEVPLAPARRKVMVQKFARHAASRLQAFRDPGVAGLIV